MIRGRPEQGWRATVLAVALFAITLNFLQPLAHAALMRSGMADSPFAVLCTSEGSQLVSRQHHADGHKQALHSHDCCLGLTQAPAMAEPPQAFLLVEPAALIVRFVAPVDALAPVGIRDGPNQPRGPPALI
jgi:Protein of unknown function (DUF2946)